MGFISGTDTKRRITVLMLLLTVSSLLTALNSGGLTIATATSGGNTLEQVPQAATNRSLPDQLSTMESFTHNPDIMDDHRPDRVNQHNTLSVSSTQYPDFGTTPDQLPTLPVNTPVTSEQTSELIYRWYRLDPDIPTTYLLNISTTGSYNLNVDVYDRQWTEVNIDLITTNWNNFTSYFLGNLTTRHYLSLDIKSSANYTILLQQFDQLRPGFASNEITYMQFNETTKLDDMTKTYAVNFTGTTDRFMRLTSTNPLPYSDPIVAPSGLHVDVPIYRNNIEDNGLIQKFRYEYWTAELNGTYYISDEFVNSLIDVSFPKVDTMNHYFLLNYTYGSQLLHGSSQSFELTRASSLIDMNITAQVTFNFSSAIPTTIPERMQSYKGLFFSVQTTSTKISTWSLNLRKFLRPLAYGVHNETLTTYSISRMQGRNIIDHYTEGSVFETTELNGILINRLRIDNTTGLIHHQLDLDEYDSKEIILIGGSRLSKLSLSFQNLGTYHWQFEDEVFPHGIVEPVKQLTINHTGMNKVNIASIDYIDLLNRIQVYVDGNEMTSESGYFGWFFILQFFLTPTNVTIRDTTHHVFDLAHANQTAIKLFSPREKLLYSMLNSTGYIEYYNSDNKDQGYKFYNYSDGTLLEWQQTGGVTWSVTRYVPDEMSTSPRATSAPTTSQQFTTEEAPLNLIILPVVGLTMLIGILTNKVVRVKQ